MSMTHAPHFETVTIPTDSVRSLAWRGDELVDWVAGGAVYRLDGSKSPARVSYSYPFDAVASSPDGHHVVLYQRRGTKGLLLHGGELRRELDRSFYHADAYEYPVCVFRDPSGRLLLAHCPKEYCRLELEDLETGERLTDHPGRKPSDSFHSRVQASPSGARLLAAGWFWHPWDAVVHFDVKKALAEPRHLDGIEGLPGFANVGLVEQCAATWQTDDRLIVAGSHEPETDPEEVAAIGDTPRVRPNGLVLYDVPSDRILSSVVLGRVAGTMMPVGLAHVVAFHGHPRLIEIATGTVIHEFAELHGGLQTSSIIHGLTQPIPPLALDPANRRFAIASENLITVVRFADEPAS
jgi:hypothetical protein